MVANVCPKPSRIERQRLTLTSLTYFNLVISVLSTFILLVKAIMFVMHIWYPLLGVISNAAITALWIVSAYGQAGPDRSDPKHESSVAWYIAKSCSYAEPTHNKGYCLQAKGAFAATVIMMYVTSPSLPIYQFLV